MTHQAQQKIESNERVGYRKPPVSHRWTKGQSGNPSGRPKKSQSNVAAELRKLMKESLEVRTRQGRTSMSREEVLVRKLVQDALHCHPRAFAEFLKLAEQVGELTDLQEPHDPIVVIGM